MTNNAAAQRLALMHMADNEYLADKAAQQRAQPNFLARALRGKTVSNLANIPYNIAGGISNALLEGYQGAKRMMTGTSRDPVADTFGATGAAAIGAIGLPPRSTDRRTQSTGWRIHRLSWQSARLRQV